MREPTVRMYDPNRDMHLLQWLKQNRLKNFFDENMLAYPGVKVLVAESPQLRGPSMIIPVQPCYMMESVGPNPEASPAEIGAALRQVTTIVKYETMRMGGKNVFFFASEPSIHDFALKHESFEEMDTTFSPLRLTLP